MRPKKIRIPSYRLHTGSGQAGVVLNGRSIYLDLWNTSESRTKDERVIAEWLANRRSLPRTDQGAANSGGLLAAGGIISEFILSFWRFAVEDLYSRRVVGWAMAEHMESRLVVDAPEMAVQRRLPDEGLLSHSDRGSQYASEHYQRLLAKHGIVRSPDAAVDSDNQQKDSLQEGRKPRPQMEGTTVLSRNTAAGGRTVAAGFRGWSPAGQAPEP